MARPSFIRWEYSVWTALFSSERREAADRRFKATPVPVPPSGRKSIPYVQHQNFRLITQTWGFPIPPCLGRLGHTPGSGRPAETNLTVRRPHQVHIYSIRFACMFLPSQQVPNGLPFSHPGRSPPVPVYCSPVGSSPRTGSLQVRRERPFSLSLWLPYSVV